MTDNSKKGLATVFLVVLIDLMGFGIVLPLLPFYADRFHVSPVAIGILYSIYSLMQLVFSPFWGSLSDRVGRRPIMLVSTIGSFIAYLMFAFSDTFALLFISRLVAGMMGGNISTAQAYVADVTNEENRSRGMGMIGAAFGMGFVVGPALATVLIQPFITDALHLTGSTHHYVLPGLVAAGMSLMSVLLVIFKLPESLKPDLQKDKMRIVRHSVFSPKFWAHLKEKGRPLLPALFFAMLIITLGHSSLYSSFPLFCRATLKLTAGQVGIQFVVMGLITVFIQGGLMRVLSKKFTEKQLFFTGNIFMIAGMALIPFAASSGMLLVFLSLMAAGASLNGPTLNSMISKQAPASEVGTVMGTSQGVAALGRVIGPTWGGYLFGVSTKLPFFVTAVVLTATLLVSFKLQD